MNNASDNRFHWHAAGPEEAFSQAESGPEGLSSGIAAERLERYGPNRITRDKKDGPLKLLWRQINNPLIWVLIGSCALAVALGKITDGLVVLAVVIINTIIGFIQEYKAGQAIEALIGMVPENATVMRDGRKVTLPVSGLVPGDVVELASGDRVPADMRLVRVKNLQVQEAALTGESLPVLKSTAPVDENAGIGDRYCMAYGGTLVVAGTGTALVTGTGRETELGRISSMLGEAADLDTPLTKKLATVGKYLTIAIIGVTILILIIGTARAMGQGLTVIPALKETVIFSIALAVGAIPEGLPAIVTIALAIGVRRMAKRNAIVRKLPAVETLGSTTVICTDKTGTLTRNEMTVVEIWTPGHTLSVEGAGYEPVGAFSGNGSPVDSIPPAAGRLLLNGALCNDASLYREGGGWRVSGDPTEAALVVAAEKAGIDVAGARRVNERMDVIPFESEHQFMATLHGGDNPRVVIKGAPEVIMDRCSGLHGESALDRELVSTVVEHMGGRGMRVLAIAEKEWSREERHLGADDVKDGFILVGLSGMIDPPRPEAIESVQACRAAGIEVKMITGDHRTTAQSIGTLIGLSTDRAAMTGEDLSRLDEGQLSEAAQHVNVFARVAPEHKIALVKSLQKNRHIVAMTGDGVNDAPALKQANIGVAMGITGTSVAKESADIVLGDDNFASIRAAVEEGRRVYDNLVKSLAFLLPTNIGIALIFIVAIMFFPFNPATRELLLPLKPAQLLWINMVAAVALALPFAFEVKEADIMRRPPRDPAEPLFSRFVIFRTIMVSVLMTLGTVLLFMWEYAGSLSAGMTASLALSESQTMAVTFVVAFQIWYMLNCRSLNDSIFAIGLFSNRTVFIGIGLVIVLHGLFIYAPFMNSVFGSSWLSLRDVAIAAGMSSVIIPIIGVEKWIRSILQRRDSAKKATSK